MNRITFPLQPKMTGPAVADLQTGLRFLIDKGFFSFGKAELQETIDRLNAEARQSAYGDATTGLVTTFQKLVGLPTDGVVNEATAIALNDRLAELGAFESAVMQRLVGGQVSSDSGQPFKGGVVRAFHEDTAGALRLGEDTTAADGRYTIRYETLPDTDIINLRVAVFDLNGELLQTSKVLLAANPLEIINLTLPPSAQRVARVYGVVCKADGELLGNMTVQAFDRDLRSEQLLGQSKTDNKGFYQITYAPDQFSQQEQGSADLVVKILATDGSLLAASPILFNAPLVATLDITVPAAVLPIPTLFEKLEEALKPLLANLAVAELEENEKHQDVSFLAGETGFTKNDLARFASAHKLAQLAIQPEFWFALLGGSFYEYSDRSSLEEQLTEVLARLPLLDATAVRKALTRSLNQSEIPEAFRTHADAWGEAFLAFVARRSVSGAKPTFVKSVLELAGVQDFKKQERFARLFNEHKAPTPELWEKLERDSDFTGAEIADLRTSFRLADLTQGDFSLIRVLREEFGVRQPQQIRTLAKKSETEWVKFVVARHAAGQIELPIGASEIAEGFKLPEDEVYGKTLARQFREAFPTTAFVGGLERSLQNGGAPGLHHAEALSRFLDSHENLELLNTPLDEFLNEHVLPDFQRLAQDESFRLELKAVQRVFKLAPTFEATDALLADNLHSAQQVYRLGETEFVRRYGDRPGFTTETARLAWNRAAETHAAVLTIVADLKALDNEVLPAALQSGSQALETFPNWDNLFKTGDLCDCEHCRSVLGPAEYFADLLMFLKDRRAKDSTLSVKDILFRRRPDLGFLELNCDNALATLPYIDVVCEVLEKAVDAAGGNDLELTGLTSIPTDTVAAQAAVKAAFSAQGITLGAEFTLSQVNPADLERWMAHGDDVTYLLKKKATPNFFAEILPNTKASAAELRAYPQYINPKAYEKLRQAIHPLGLPFDLFAAEVRAAFQKSNLQRWDLMETLRGPAAPNNPTEGEIAAEYFSISADPLAAFDEKRLILVTNDTVAGQQAVWGVAGSDWLQTVSNVKVFLQKTGLEYNDLLALLDLKFINPAGAISIQHLDSSCDTEQQVIQGFDVATLDRIHRLLRLWRKLDGWKLWELELVVRHPRIGNGTLDEPFLINLFYFRRLRKRLGAKTTVEQVCALFGDLNIETRFTKLHEKKEDALYHYLFLNRRLIQPLDPAFQLDPSIGGLPVGETITAHHSVVLAALGISEADLVVFEGLTKASDGTAYITDDLTLANLSFLWRHAWLSQLLKFKAEAWQILLKLSQQDLAEFADPQSAWEFLESIDQLKASGFTPDELDWLLAANRTAKAATKEADAARFLVALRQEMQALQAQHDPAQFGFLTAVPLTDVDSLTVLLTTLLQQLNRDEAATQFFLATLRDEVRVETVVTGLPASFDFPPAIKAAIRIRYAEPAATLRFTGLMTPTERTTLLNDLSLSAVTGSVAYQDAIEELFTRPRLALKFFDPVFTVPLANLPVTVDFKSLPDPALACKISYDAEQRLLRLAGILSKEERAALDALSANLDYRSAVNSLSTQPVLIAPPDERIWLLDADLQSTDHLAENLATAATKALVYLSKTLSENAVVQQGASLLRLPEALTRRLFTDYALLPDTLLAHLTEAFAATTGAVDYATLKTTFDAWYWAIRAATMLKKWKLTLTEYEKIVALTTAAQLLDFLTLPLDDVGTPASRERLLRTSRLLRLRDNLPEAEITLLEVLEKLNVGATRAEFAVDVERLNEAWRAVDVQVLVDALDLSYPGEYLLAEGLERLRRALYFIESLNAGADTVIKFATVAMNDIHAKTLKELLRAKFGAETWLALSADIQDVLRECKRDALAAYLLAQPADAPSGKWENTNDLYAYYLLDVEMSSCQLTSRLVQGSGSVQLFVQRAFMGLEPEVEVRADGDDGDSAWRWWKWMRKYRVWEANRKVFLWPENWIEPELKPDRSQFFKDLENELLQNEVNQHTVETAFQNYLEKLDGVAQLEIAGFFQEDDGDDTILHVFGRTPGAEPHIYYYRRYDYRQWTPWEKVDLDIQSDYLIPAVLNGRLFLFWPEFSEVPDEDGNSRVSTPSVNQPNVFLDKTKKKLRVHMSVSELQQNGIWTSKRISKDFDQSMNTYTATDAVHKLYRFILIERADSDGHLDVLFEGSSVASSLPSSSSYPQLKPSTFEIAGCNGVPELGNLVGNFNPAIRPEFASTGLFTPFNKWEELSLRGDFPQNDFTLENVFANQPNSLRFRPVLMQTPDIFRMSPPWHLSYLDKLLLDGSLSLKSELGSTLSSPIGSWLPFFYNDKKRTFFVLSSLAGIRGGRLDGLSTGGIRVRYYYPEIKKIFRQLDEFYAGKIQALLNIIIPTLPPAQRQQLEQALSMEFPEEGLPPYSDEQLMRQAKRALMRRVHLYLGNLSLQLLPHQQFHFNNFYHPFVCDFRKLASNPIQGIPALMSRKTQLKNSGFSFRQRYQPTPAIVDPATEAFYPKEIVDFAPDGAYSPYNWELFFHAPLLIANALSKNQRFEEARDWYHFIFNPLGVESAVSGGSTMSKYWITKPFFETTDSQYIQQRIENILRMLAGDTSVSSFSAQARQAIDGQVRDWRTHPFEPHRIANYRTVAYQKTVVMKYLDNLITWGDYLFRQDSMESNNEATQLYVLAAEILGPRPKKIPQQVKPPVQSFNELENEFDKFSNALIQVENLVPSLAGSETEAEDAAPLPMLYFCIPQNDKMLGYWDMVADRLFKIRHCMNIEGLVRQLALFEPPVDPGALVKPVAAGVDISAVLSDLNAPLPLYRFNVLLQKANELCNDVKALGNALLAALEKKDAEALGLLRQGQEIRLLEAMKEVRAKQIDEASDNLEALTKSKELAQMKKQYYESREFMNLGEGLALQLSIRSTLLDIPISLGYIHAGVLESIPKFLLGTSGFGGSPHATAETPEFSKAAELAIAGLAQIARNLDKVASLSNTLAGYSRRQEEWIFQRDVAAKEIEQIDKSIAAAELRVAIAEKERDNHNLQTGNANEINAFMQNKYTNEELFQWQVGQISGVYFQSYQLAYDLAKRAERCFRFELGLLESERSYINFGYWDSLKKGLLAGEKLQYDLRRLETAYLEENRREFELTKHVSLAMLDPLALIQLRETGRCFVNLPEEIFDLDYPGHYFRRIKSVSLTLPCVVGPYTSISCTLRLLKNSIRVNRTDANTADTYPRHTDEQGLPAEDDRFIENNIPVKAMVASSAQNDSGMFELSFRDERYLPFEGAGVISDWSLELFNDKDNADFGKALRQFDYGTISDVILHVKYTAREDASSFKQGAVAHLRDYFSHSQDRAMPSLRLFNLRQEFPTQWQRFLNPTNPVNGNVFELDMSLALFNYRDHDKTLKVNTITVLARCSDEGDYTIVLTSPMPASPETFTLSRSNQSTSNESIGFGDLHFVQKDVAGARIEIAPTDPPAKWQFKMTRPGGGSLQQDLATNRAEVVDALVVLGYEWKEA